MIMAKVSTIREKIAHLLALAESPEPEEAKAAMLRDRELMAKYKLRPEECVDAENTKVIRETVGVTCTAMTNPWACALSAVIAEHYCCQAYRSRMPGRKVVTVGLVGLEDDFEIAKRIFLYAYDCVISAIKQSITYDPRAERGTYREKCNAYGWGFVAGVEAAFRDQEEEHKDWGLVLVVPQAVTDSMADMGKKTTFGTIKNNHADCGAAGFEEGRKFDPTRRVAGGSEQMALGGGC